MLAIWQIRYTCTCMYMQITRLKTHQLTLVPIYGSKHLDRRIQTSQTHISPNLMLAKVTHYMTLYMVQYTPCLQTHDRGKLRAIHKDMYKRAKRILRVSSFQHIVTLSYMYTKVATRADFTRVMKLICAQKRAKRILHVLCSHHAIVAVFLPSGADHICCPATAASNMYAHSHTHTQHMAWIYISIIILTRILPSKKLPHPLPPPHHQDTHLS